MLRITGIVFAITAILLITLSSQAQDGVTLTNEVGPRGKTSPGKMQSTDWSDPEELKRKWDGAKVRIPTDTGIVKATMTNLRNVPERKKYPTVIYMHGYNGFWKGTDRRVDFLAQLNFAVIAPDSFARNKVPIHCFQIRQPSLCA